MATQRRGDSGETIEDLIKDHGALGTRLRQFALRSRQTAISARKAAPAPTAPKPPPTQTKPPPRPPKKPAAKAKRPIPPQLKKYAFQKKPRGR